ncbi:esterase [Heterostelium album PN500]|uniref:Esterase n=1 Tax=Heterostelium pallidum (strain ATCC 26659 / Pp 5 / PN500) TaxID=670386 RepID=D3AYD8_HETP5|nr:esterase [Heterostelium album PN500]EFA85965.1 esterase [Heterostelium album PN500]|eukprot:XP_020438071.1 esterase [Heterostelium album PN500]
MNRYISILVFAILSIVSITSVRGQQLISPSNENLLYMGRVDSSSNDVYYFDWSGVGISMIITGTATLKVLMDTNTPTPSTNNINMFTVLINNAVYPPLNITSTEMESYDLVSYGTLVPTESYIITLIKRTEASLGVIGFYGFMVDQAAVIVLPPSFPRKLEFFGDSITCGYGIDALAPCPFTPQTENNFDTYEYIISRQLSTQLHTACWSGKGLVRNYDSPNITSTNPMPIYLPRTLANNASLEWDFANYVPDAVVINLGTNDYSTQPSPPENLFEQTYINLIQTINNWYPNKPKIFLVCGPMISGAVCDYVESVSETVESATYIDLQNILDDSDYGCNGHPNQSGHAKMAEIAYPIIQKVMQW